MLLLDEPATHLDVRHQLHLFRVLDEVRQQGVAVLAVVHDLPRAAAWAPRMALVHEGRIAADGPPEDVLGGAAAARRVRGGDPRGSDRRAGRRAVAVRGAASGVASEAPAERDAAGPAQSRGR